MLVTRAYLETEAAPTCLNTSTSSPCSTSPTSLRCSSTSARASGSGQPTEWAPPLHGWHRARLATFPQGRPQTSTSGRSTSRAQRFPRLVRGIARVDRHPCLQSVVHGRAWCGWLDHRLCNAGYGDLTGSTPLELVVSIIMQITGVLFFASVVGNFAATISQSRAEEQRCVHTTMVLSATPPPPSQHGRLSKLHAENRLVDAHAENPRRHPAQDSHILHIPVAL